MSVVATLLKQVPAAAKFKPKLMALEKELAQLRNENTQLREDLAQFINQWETLDGPQVSALQYLAAHTRGHAADIAQSAQMNIQIAETSLVFLRQYDYVNAEGGGKPALGKKSPYTLSAKGARYLRERGLHK